MLRQMIPVGSLGLFSSFCSSRAKDCILCVFSAIFLSLSFSSFNIWIFAWFGFVPLFFVINNKSKVSAFLLSYFTGFIFWLGTIYWLIHVTLPGTVVLCLYLALYFGIFGLIFSTFNPQLLTVNLLFIPSLWVLLEYIRSHLFTGFPWALLAYSQYLNLPAIQIADIFGAWGVSFLVMMANVLLYRIIGAGFKVLGKKEKILAPLLLLVLSLSYGFYKLSQAPNTKQQTAIRVSVIQGNIPQELKWDARAREFIMDRYFNLTYEVIKDNPDLIIWPEAAIPAVLEEEPRYYKLTADFVQKIARPLVFGAVTSSNNFYYNSALLVSGEGRLLQKYDKLHLVPFGEYIPLKKILPFLETVVPIGDFTAGREYAIFKILNPKSETLNKLQTSNSRLQTKFAVLICFEDLFPKISREFVRRGIDFLVNITNDAWYKRTSAPYQHLQASVFRAVENRAFLARAANTGISGFIAPSGKVISSVNDQSGRNIFIGGYNTCRINIVKRAPTFYTRYGDIFIAFCFLFVLYGMILALCKKV